jgi:hypothetical protein
MFSIMTRMRLIFMSLLVFAVTLAVTAPSFAQSSPQARREELAKVQEMLSDPDPLMRLANMEAIVTSGDGLKTMLAIRTAFASDDADLRGLALRAYLATHKDLTFTVSLPPAVEKQFDTATPNTLHELIKQFPYVARLNNIAFRFQLAVKDYTLGQDAGHFDPNNRIFTIAGDKVSSAALIPGVGDCYVNFWPGKKQNLDGMLACQGGWPRLAISAPAF